ncbi:OmpH family outer membrane protein [Deinococcus wulumuqiensis]|uniref:Cationic outer membrane protein OmpH n=1 Tax=Deinococcus wulumuqiensis TaxID=980427 RepID=A0AAV4K292_9DEIO|nr:OmpH family outer membrane protein [Deinococcus wulumuqiensis]GGI72217.1 cationic outer membrane protein OmpH [Deinococcus wulumuqiensis]GGP30931.1 cationic outer membrane protein OmpH [Deinococcus wulumuqiensis]
MKITAKALAPVALAAAFGFGTLAPHAQTPAQKVGFVNVDALFAAHPGNKDVLAMSESLNKDAALTDTVNKLRAIDAKGASATAAEKQQRETLLATYNAKTKALNDKTAQVETAIDKSLNDYAKANGFSVIMDRAIAQQSGLVIYADSSTDLTDAVKKTIK